LATGAPNNLTSCDAERTSYVKKSPEGTAARTSKPQGYWGGKINEAGPGGQLKVLSVNARIPVENWGDEEEASGKRGITTTDGPQQRVNNLPEGRQNGGGAEKGYRL